MIWGFYKEKLNDLVGLKGVATRDVATQLHSQVFQAGINDRQDSVMASLNLSAISP